MSLFSYHFDSIRVGLNSGNLDYILVKKQPKTKRKKEITPGVLPDSTFSCCSSPGAEFSRWANTAANGLAASGSVRYISQSR